MELELYSQKKEETMIFYKTPKIFYTDKKYRNLSSDAKVLYGIMLDRENLSIRNNWQDEQGRVYIYMTVDCVEELLGCARQKAVGLLKDLENFDLIEKKRQGLGKPTIIYVKKLD